MFGFLRKESSAVAAPVSGRCIRLEGVADKVFSSKMMGDGFAVELTEGDVKAPVSGVIAAAFPTGHAFGIKTKEGMEVLLHIGVDTVNLQGKGFDVKVKEGDAVKQGDLLVKVDIDYVKSQGKSIYSPVIFTGGQKIDLLKTGAVTAGDGQIIKIG